MYAPRNLVRPLVVVLLWFLAFSGNCQSILRDTVIHVMADPSLGFLNSYLIFLPAGTPTEEPLVMIVEAADGDSIPGSAAPSQLPVVGKALAMRLKVPLLLSLFPGTDAQLLGRSTLLTRRGNLKRIDLQLLAMIGSAYAQLDSRKVKIRNKVILTGFGPSSVFASRFAALHPQAAELVTYGGNDGMILLPVETINEFDLAYPLGISDFRKVSGKPFDRNAFRSVPQFIFQGADDSLSVSELLPAAERRIFWSVLGITASERLTKCYEIFDGNGSNATFRTYPNTGHVVSEAILEDVEKFWRANADR